MDGTPSLSVDGLRKEFGAVKALAGVDLHVSEPAIIGLAGPNGSGKTTLIRCLLGLDEPTAGEAQIGDIPSRALGRADRTRIGYMPQERAVYDDLTVRENVAFFARLYGVRDANAVDRALSVVDLADRGDARVDELSGGMIRRTSLACAIVHDPDVLVLDEPTVGLDPQLRASMWSEFRQRRDGGTLVLVSTHYLGEADNCDQVCFLRDGRVLAIDSPANFLERTDTESMEAAFLALLERADERGAPEDGDRTGRAQQTAAAGSRSR